MRTYLSDCDIGYVRLLYNILFLQYAIIENIEQKRMDTLPSTSLCDEQKIAYWAKVYPKAASQAKSEILRAICSSSDSLNDTKEQACGMLRLTETREE